METRFQLIRVVFNLLCILGFICLLCHPEIYAQKGPSIRISLSSRKHPIQRLLFSGRRLGESNATNSSISGSSSSIFDTKSDTGEVIIEDPSSCVGVNMHKGSASSCEFLRAHSQCDSGGFFDYLKFFYCSCKGFPFIGYGVMAIWLAALFYMLGNTAADYFCCSLEKLSGLLKLAPTVAGVTLLPLGNGAPDVFASIAAFVGHGTGEVGLNSVLGGAVFVTCVVVGTVSLCVANDHVQIDRKCFIRDVCFFLLTLVFLSLILFVGKISVWGAIGFILIYVVYAVVVAANEVIRKHASKLHLDVLTPMLPMKGSIFSQGLEEDESVYSPLLDMETVGEEAERLSSSLPQWMWASNVAIYSNQTLKTAMEPKPLWGWSEEMETDWSWSWSSFSCSKLFLWVLELPLALPRKLTIPIVEEGRWSKAYAVGSAFFAPVLLVFLWNSGQTGFSSSSTAVYVFGVVLGTILATLAHYHTTSDSPPRRFMFVWVSGGFMMSIVWFYIIASELVALLVSFGIIFEINPAILGLTVLAWGNSMGDLMSNVALAMNGGDGVQIALSGCYAGPMFNTLIGLGASMLLGAWSQKPAPFVIPEDASLMYTMAVLVGGLLWALIVLPRNDMRPSKLLGGGLIFLYVSFMLTRALIATHIFSASGLQ